MDKIDELEHFRDLSREETATMKVKAKSAKIQKDFAKAEKWIFNNAHRFDDPAKFKAAFIKRFTNKNAFISELRQDCRLNLVINLMMKF